MTKPKNMLSENKWAILLGSILLIAFITALIVVPAKKSTHRLNSFIPDTNLFGLIIEYGSSGVWYTNRSDIDWADCSWFMINNHYVDQNKHDIKSNSNLFIPYGEFEDTEGNKFDPKEEKAQEFKIQCDNDDGFYYDEFFADDWSEKNKIRK